jgi:hypothetical protein
MEKRILTDGTCNGIVIDPAKLDTIQIWEKEVMPEGIPPLEFDNVTQVMYNNIYRTGDSGYLKSTHPVTVNTSYTSDMVKGLYERLNKTQTFQFTFLPRHPLFLMSPGIKVYRARDISELKFEGYLDKFEPTEDKDTGEPEISCTIVPTNTPELI